ncbi:MAG: SAM-dependent methyltransferase [Nocardiopsaceae bacterium]|nr:SAM-dependent methyltransferase [Nocardiopsaceae bacterium]
MTDEWRALRIGDEHPFTDIPVPRVVHISEHLARSRVVPPPPPPPSPRAVQARSGFLRRVAAYLAADAGIRQFVDLWSRLPAGAGIRHTARAHAPDARVVYVDTDRAGSAVPLRSHTSFDGEAVPVVTADRLDPTALIDRLRLGELVDFDRPVAVLLTDISPLRREGVLVHDLVRALYTAMCAGSHIAIAQTPPSAPDPYFRELAAALFAPFTMLSPGLADLAWWPYPDDEVAAQGTGILAGVGYKG